jgi:hypothetical protein
MEDEQSITKQRPEKSCLRGEMRESLRVCREKFQWPSFLLLPHKIYFGGKADKGGGKNRGETTQSRDSIAIECTGRS